MICCQISGSGCKKDARITRTGALTPSAMAKARSLKPVTARTIASNLLLFGQRISLFGTQTVNVSEFLQLIDIK
jgi:hypothetical protein